jgi:hypothetical protein
VTFATRAETEGVAAARALSEAGWVCRQYECNAADTAASTVFIRYIRVIRGLLKESNLSALYLAGFLAVPL